MNTHICPSFLRQISSPQSKDTQLTALW